MKQHGIVIRKLDNLERMMKNIEGWLDAMRKEIKEKKDE